MRILSLFIFCLTFPVASFAQSAIRSNPSVLVFDYVVGDIPPSPQSLAISSANSNNTSFVAVASTDNGAWLSITPTRGTIPGTLVAAVDPAGLAPGAYRGSITVAASSGSATPPLVVPVLLNVSLPTLVSDLQKLDFRYRLGDNPPPSQSISLSSTVPANPLPFTVTSLPNPGEQWMSVTADPDTTLGRLVVSVDPGALRRGTYLALIRIAQTGGLASQIFVVVSLAIDGDPTDPNFTAAPTIVAIGNNPQELDLGSTGPTLNFTSRLSQIWPPDASFVSIPPSQGLSASQMTPAPIPVTLAGNPPADNYYAFITVESADYGGCSRTILVRVARPEGSGKGAPVLQVISPDRLIFEYQRGGALPQPQLLRVSGRPSLRIETFTSTPQVDWLSVSPRNVSNSANISVSVNPTQLGPGTTSGFIRAIDTSNNSVAGYASVTVHVNDQARLVSGAAQLAFRQRMGGPALTRSFDVTSTSDPIDFTVNSSLPGDCLSVTASAARTPATVSITVTCDNLPSHVYNGSVQIVGGAAGTINIPVTLTRIAPSLYAVGGERTLTVAPGSIIEIALDPDLQDDPLLPPPAQDSSVTINGVMAPAALVTATRVQFQVPYEITPGPATTAVAISGLPTASVDHAVSHLAPSILANFIQNASGSRNGFTNPACPGSEITFYLTGQGPLDIPIPTAAPAPQIPPSVPVYTPRVLLTAETFGAEQSNAGMVQITSASMAPGLIGILQLRAKLPLLTPPMDLFAYFLEVEQGNQLSNPVFITIARPGNPACPQPAP